jgi:hypothetical protein
MYDLLLKGGKVVDPSAGPDGVKRDAGGKKGPPSRSGTARNISDDHSATFQLPILQRTTKFFWFSVPEFDTVLP